MRKACVQFTSVCAVALALLLLAGALVGCASDNAPTLQGSKPYSYEKAIDRGDVVLFNEYYNLEAFTAFLSRVDSKEPASIRITGYTDEGDPIFKDLNYDGKQIQYTHDNTNDKFGGDKGVWTDTCAKISSEGTEREGVRYTVYSLSGCKKQEKQISYYLLSVESLDQAEE